MLHLHHRFYRLIVVGLLLSATAATISAHPVLTPNEAVGTVGTLISLLRVVSLAMSAGWVAYTFLDSTPSINRRYYAFAWALVLVSLWSDLSLDWARSNEMLIDGNYLDFRPEYLNLLLQSERAGILWLRIIGALLLGAPLLKAPPVTRWTALIGGGIVALASAWLATATTFSGDIQPAITPGGQIGQIAGQGLHLYLAALWFGGLIAALVTVVRRQTTAAVSLRAFLRYTQLCLAAIVITGLTLAWVRVGSIPALLQTGYGWLTLIKAGVVIGLMVLGNRWMSTQQPSVRQELMLQGGLILIAVVTSAMLTTLDSARSVTEWRTDEYFHSFDNSFYDARIERPLEIDLIVIPGLTGENRFIVTLIDSEVGIRLDDAQRVVVNLSSAQSGNEPKSLPLQPAGDGNYIAVTTLSDAGGWNADVEVSRDDINRSAEFPFTLNVPPPDLPSLLSIEASVAFSPLDRIVSGMGGILLIMLGASEMVSRRRSNSQRIVMMLSVLCIAIGLTLLVASML
jgi:putative copper export protein